MAGKKEEKKEGIRLDNGKKFILNRKINYNIIKTVWMLYNPKKNRDGNTLEIIYDTTIGNRSGFDKVVAGSTYSGSIEEDVVKRFGLPLDIMLGNQILEVPGISQEDLVSAYSDSMSSKQINRDDIEEQIRTQASEVRSKLETNGINPKNNFHKLCYFCKYIRPLPEKDLRLIGLQEAERNEEGDGGWDMQMMEELAGPIKEAPEWVEWMYDLLAAVCVGVLSILAWHGIRAVFAEFRASHDENGDLVEEILTEEDDVMESLKLRRIRRRRDGTGVRRTYRRMIQTYRKDKPEPWESPAEIEEKAGLAEDAGMQELHLKYENVRYGNGAGESWSEKNKAFIKKI